LSTSRKLSEVCDPGTKVIVIGAANDIALYRELMRRGVSEYLVPPLGTLQLIAAITALYADPRPSRSSAARSPSAAPKAARALRRWRITSPT
jgi:response regulator of citrate/malate metabolism